MNENECPAAADIHTASEDYAGRFAGPAGAWMLRVQERIVLGWLAAHPGATILDVGGGHGQLAAPLARRGFKVTVQGSDVSCSRRLRADIDGGQVRFITGKVTALPVADRSYDIVISIRLLPHCPEWPQLVRELCRVARLAVIVDYPTTRSVNFLADRLFSLKKRIEGNTRRFTLFRHATVAQQFARNGFRLAAQKAEFFLPMLLHRVLRCPPVSAGVEGLFRGVGLTGLFGSPVLVKFVPGRL